MEPPTGPAGAAAVGEPGAPPVTEEQLREYLAQLRTAPVEQVLTEVLSGLLSAAQAKLGRRDARLLIDISAQAVDHARAHLSAGLSQQLDQALGQLRREQVRAEEQVAAQTGSEPNDLGQTPAPPQPAGAQQPSRPSPPGAESGLWVPGR